jgi:hypothetical protein
MDAIASEAFRSIRTVRSFAGESLERERFDTYCDEAQSTGVGFARAKVPWLMRSRHRGHS